MKIKLRMKIDSNEPKQLIRFYRTIDCAIFGALIRLRRYGHKSNRSHEKERGESWDLFMQTNAHEMCENACSTQRYTYSSGISSE